MAKTAAQKAADKAAKEAAKAASEGTAPAAPVGAADQTQAPVQVEAPVSPETPVSNAKADPRAEAWAKVVARIQRDYPQAYEARKANGEFDKIPASFDPANFKLD